MSRIITTEIFIADSKKIHGDKYGYEKTVYTYGNEPVVIFCKKCGRYFSQRASHHLEGSGCPVCQKNERKITTKEFIQRAVAVHGNRYDYSKSVYTGRNKKLIILCRDHGEFLQVPHSHLSGAGCPICANHQTIDKEEYIRRVKAIHGEKYSFEETVYINSTTPLSVRCKKHNYLFKIKPHNLLNKTGCPLCAKEKLREGKAKDVSQFIRDAKSIHGEKYDYSQVKYINSHTKVTIRCIKHNYLFTQEPSSHLAGNGCPLCGREGTSIARSSNTEEFVKKLQAMYQNKFDYTKVNYKDNRTRILIKCNDHDQWFQSIPSVMLRGIIGCPVCLQEHKALVRRSNTEEFIEKARLIHGDKYNYDLVVYETAIKKVTLRCNKHNRVFRITPNSHLCGVGCPWCNRSKAENEIERILKDRKIEFVPQKTFSGCKYKKLLPFDFYLPKYNATIEYQGKQHYESIKFYGGDIAFAARKIKDNIKREFCKNAGIKLIEISYWDENRIEEYISEIIRTDPPAWP